MKEIKYSEPYDYFERRKDEKIEGLVVFANKIVEGESLNIREPFLIVSKQERSIYALRLKNDKYNYKVSWNGVRPFDRKLAFTLEDKIEVNFIDNGKEASVYLDSDQGTILFKADLTKWYKLKHLDKVEDAVTFIIDKINFNYIIERIISADPFGEVANWYSVSNWEE